MIWLSMNGYYMRTEDENKTQDLCMEISKTDDGVKQWNCLK